MRIMEVICQAYSKNNQATFVPLPNIGIAPVWPEFFDERWCSSLPKKNKDLLIDHQPSASDECDGKPGRSRKIATFSTSVRLCLPWFSGPCAQKRYSAVSLSACILLINVVAMD
jgi:hypothetical protein